MRKSGFPGTPSRNGRSCGFSSGAARLLARWFTACLPRRGPNKVPDELLNDVLPDNALRAIEELRRKATSSQRSGKDW